ncbi:YfjI family protein [Eubacterium sp. AB3007]|uniref:YfjI family protein n=1 Tax=Eubacterium sp. AB3007 TaxID=1392487 RepID=UPI00068BA343|nr:YfjI family protein [Eubacterium sp. AB3007]
MRELRIAYGKKSNAKVWKNATITWDALCEKLRTTIKTNETAEEYRSMRRAEKDAVKDKGGFVGGYLRDGRRLSQNVECRSFLTLDADEAEPCFLEHFAEHCKHAAAIYTTHGSTPQDPRVRIIVPFEKDISPDCYVAVARYYAAEWGIDQFDDCSFRVNQLMFWPTTPADVEYVCKVIPGPFLNAMEYLEQHPNWRDCSMLPASSREQAVRVSDGRKQEDPLSKDGTVGAFCRTYTIQETIRKFLGSVYAESTVEGRYDYIPGEGSAGVVVYDDKYCYSHHATDPAGGRLLNAFDLVRVHRFGEEDEKTSFLKMCGLAESDELVCETIQQEKLAEAQKEFESFTESGEEPIPFGKYSIEAFPVDALPLDIADYICAVAESTQTPVDMAGTAVLSLISVCIQGKYVVQGKPDWIEPLNTFTNIIASPSERKSAVLHAIVSPADDYEVQFNQRHAGEVESSKMQKRILERRQKSVEDMVAKGKAQPDEIRKIADEIAAYKVRKPLRLYVDDITTEKLVSVMASNDGRAALISSEGGIFDTLAGIYTRNVNIDVMLKGYSGDTIRMDRIGRESESIMHPALTILLMTQPKVVSDVLSNKTFRGRGLTARFLYCLPTSTVGERKFQSRSVSEQIYRRYESKIINMLEEEYPAEPEVIALSTSASTLLTAFAEELEPKLKKDYTEISDWAGKLVGNTLRIAGLLCRASVYRSEDFLRDHEYLVVDEKTMSNAIRLGRYFLSHALAVYDVVPESAMYKQADLILQKIREKGMKEFDRRKAMRACRTFKTAAEIQPILDFLDDYGYIIRQPEKTYTAGRPPLPKYVTHPSVLSE